MSTTATQSFPTPPTALGSPIVAQFIGGSCRPMTILSRVVSWTVTAKEANVGNGILLDLACGSVLDPGDYVVRLTGRSTFDVNAPDRKVIGSGTVGSPFSAGGLSFLLVDGSLDFSENDRFVVRVATKGYTPFAPGTNDPTGILLEAPSDSGGVFQVLAAGGEYEIDEDRIRWPAAITEDQRAAALAKLRDRGLRIRPGAGGLEAIVNACREEGQAWFGPEAIMRGLSLRDTLAALQVIQDARDLCAAARVAPTQDLLLAIGLRDVAKVVGCVIAIMGGPSPDTVAPPVPVAPADPETENRACVGEG